ncbi:hypothetical protein ACIPUD_10875 [Bradyrhizobium sp. CAR08]
MIGNRRNRAIVRNIERNDHALRPPRNRPTAERQADPPRAGPYGQALLSEFVHVNLGLIAMAQATLKVKIWTEGRGKRLPNDLSDLAELFAPHVEHVAGLCGQGYQSGEIVDDKFTGWWTLERT